MSKSKPLHTLATLSLPASVALLIELARTLLQAQITNKVIFTSPIPSTAQLKTDIDSLDAAQSAAKTRGAGLCAIRDEKRKVVVSDLHQLVAYVQQTANLNPEQAASIIESAGMTVRKHGTHAKSDLAVKPATAGAAHLVAKAIKGARAHEWQYSADGGKTWVSAPVSAQAKTTIGNLPTATLVYFRHRSVTKAGPGDWSSSVSVLIA
jgi:hypothetical protein